jgi:KDO2-lipid IV(A) lauroyltransferase
VSRFGPLIEPPEIADREEAIQAFTRRFDEVIEAGVRRHPEQWFWFHKRWKLPKGFPQENPQEIPKENPQEIPREVPS